MPTAMKRGDQVMELIVRKLGCAMEELLIECPNLTWNQIFIELDRLSRLGHIKLVLKGPGQYVAMPGDQLYPHRGIARLLDQTSEATA
jgi:hypothetical protein